MSLGKICIRYVRTVVRQFVTRVKIDGRIRDSGKLLKISNAPTNYSVISLSETAISIPMFQF